MKLACFSAEPRSRAAPAHLWEKPKLPKQDIFAGRRGGHCAALSDGQQPQASEPKDQMPQRARPAVQAPLLDRKSGASAVWDRGAPEGGTELRAEGAVNTVPVPARVQERHTSKGRASSVGKCCLQLSGPLKA